ncbi:MAG: hypothetical protein ACI9FN_000317 [Saprospiraceae bacterium]|jgi:hypothetical protein
MLKPIHIGDTISSIGRKYSSVWMLLLLCLTSFGVKGQICPLDTLTVPDTLVIYSNLGDCEISSEEFLGELGIENCVNAMVFPTGPYVVKDDKMVNIFDQATNKIVSTFYLKILPTPLTSYIPTGPGSQLINDFIEFPLAAGETNATKEMILDQLGVVDNDVIRSQIHFYQGNSRVTNFTIGDTAYIDRVECNSINYYQDIKILFTPQVETFGGNMDFDIGLSTCKVTIEDVLARLGYNMNDASPDRFTISQSGSFGYGDHLIQSIKLDEYPLLDGATISVSSAEGPRFAQDFGVLVEGQCFLNETDITEMLGINQSGRDCNLNLVSYIPAGPYRDTVTMITQILIDGITVWSSSFDVRYEQSDVFVETTNLFCNDNLNISMNRDCEVFIDADDLLQGGAYCHLNYDIQAAFTADPDNVIYQGTKITIKEPGNYQVTITNPSSSNKCWSTIAVEDKYIAEVTCVPDTVNCYEPNHLQPDTIDGGGPDFPSLDGNPFYTETNVAGFFDVTTDNTCQISTASYIDQLVDECQGEFKHVIDRLWTFTDPSGNSDTCTQRIYVRSADIDLIDRFDRFEADCIGDFTEVDENGYPLPSITGYPTIDSIHDARSCGNLKMSYEDTPFPLCGRSIKLARRWSILDWCTDEVRYLDQIIQIEDKSPPEFTEPLEDFSIESDAFICGQLNIALPEPVFQDCDEDVSWHIYYETITPEGNRILKDNGSSLIIPEILMMEVIASFDVIYELMDACGNMSRDTLMLTIEDKEVPVAVCNFYTSISVSGNGEAQVRALTFDDLSVDNCGVASYMARKLDGDCYVREEFAETVKFCCAEVGDTLHVEFQVEDWAGNTNTCKVNVFVQDKFKPQITCPDSVFLNCGQDFTDFSLTGMPTYRDNCDGLELISNDEEFLNSCGEGYIKRQWVVTDRGEFEAICVQIIIMNEENPFVLEDVEFPSHVTLEGCMGSLEPETTGSPILTPKGCASVDASHDDQYFYNVDEACYKIIREWTIVDWCQLDDNNAGAGFWTSVQIIKVNSELGPVITLPNAENFCIEDNSCSTAIALLAAATDGDQCTAEEDIIWTYGLWNANTGMPIKAGDSGLVSATLEAGDYQVIFTARDDCNNATMDTLYFSVLDCSPPEIICPPLQPTIVLNEQGERTLTVDELNATLSDNCNNTEDVRLSFDRAAIITTREYSCADITDGVEEVGFLTLYAHDQSGNIDSCEMFLLIRDNSANVCPDLVDPDIDTVTIAGLITTEESIEVEGVNVSLISDTGIRSLRTAADGTYAFANLDMGVSYELSMLKNDNITDGVTTSDIVLIQRHLLGWTFLDSPYKLIAADTDNNGKVTSADLVGLRNVLLGRTLEFKGGQKSWRFVDVNQVFVNEYSPFPFVEKLSVSDLTNDLMDADFMAIKIGDVNGSNTINKNGKSKPRNAGIKIKTVRKNGSVLFVSTVEDRLAGIQLSILNNSESDLQMNAGILDIEDEHIRQDDGGLTISWSEPSDKIVNIGDVLFSISTTSDKLELVKDAASEWIDGEVSVSEIFLGDQESVEIDILNISPISPNPWNDYATYTIELQAPTQVDVEILTIEGRSLYNMNRLLPQGTHSFSLSSSDINDASGLLIMKVRAGGLQHVQRMTVLR